MKGEGDEEGEKGEELGVEEKGRGWQALGERKGREVIRFKALSLLNFSIKGGDE